jgi:hypothetical protein
LSYLNTYFVILPSSQKFPGIVVVIVNFGKFYITFASPCCVKDLSPGTPIFSLAAQMQMRYQAVDHDGVTMLQEGATLPAVLLSNYKHFYRREYRVNL